MASPAPQKKQPANPRIGIKKKRLSDHFVSIFSAKNLGAGGVASIQEESAQLTAALEDCELLRQQLAAQTQDLDLAIKRADNLEQDLLQFVYSTSHDLNAPLRAIDGFSTLLSQEPDCELNDIAERYLERIATAAKRMKCMLDSISEYAQFSTVKFQRSQVNLNIVLDQVLHDLHEKIQQSKAVVTREELPMILADQVQLSHLMRHLIDNSISFPGNEKPQVNVSAKRHSDQWLIKVQDNGRGIAAEQIKSAFEMFRRFGYDSRAEGGTGAGLTICKQIIERHGGKIFIESEIDIGTTVTFSINIVEQPKELTPTQPNSQRNDGSDTR